MHEINFLCVSSIYHLSSTPSTVQIRRVSRSSTGYTPPSQKSKNRLCSPSNGQFSIPIKNSSFLDIFLLETQKIPKGRNCLAAPRSMRLADRLPSGQQLPRDEESLMCPRPSDAM